MAQHCSAAALRGRPVALLVLALVLALGSPSPATSDSCADVQETANNFGALKPSEVEACLDTFPYSADTAAAVLDTVTKGLSAHVFSVPKLRSDLAKIAAATYETERAFHDAVRAAFVNNKDVHLTYDSKCFHSAWSSSLLLPVTAVANAAGGQDFYIHPEVSSYADYTDQRIWPGVDVSQYAGARVFRINGVRPLSVMLGLARSPIDPLARSFASRLSLGLASKGWTFDSDAKMPAESFSWGAWGSRSTIPSSDSVQILLQRVGTTTKEAVNVPWQVYYTGEAGFGTTSDEFYAGNCALAAGDPGAATVGTQAVQQQSRTGRQARQVPNLVPRALGGAVAGKRQGRGRRLDSAQLDPVYTGNLTGYLLADGITGVVVLPTFSITAPKLNSDLSDCIAALQGAGATRLIIDLRGNGGGNVVTGLQLVNTLFPSVTSPSPPYVFSGSTYMQRMVLAELQNFNATFCATAKGCRFRFSTWRDVDDNSYTNAEDFFFPVATAPLMQASSPLGARAVATASTTTRVSLPFRQKFTGFAEPSSDPPFDADSILLLTDAACQSTCATAVYILSLQQNVKIVYVGGVPGGNPTISRSVEGAGGAFINLEDELLKQEVVPLERLNNPDQPYYFPVKAKMTLVVRAVLSDPNPKVSRAYEFLPLPPNYRLYNTMDIVNSAQGAWAPAAAFFPAPPS